MNPPNVELGKAAEKRAEIFLKGRNLSAICSNYRTPFGEIDLIMRDRDTLVFVEVRYRRNRAYGNAAESIGPDKQARIARCAHEFMKTHRHDGPTRFDVVAFDGDVSKTPEWVKNAFESDW